MTLRGALNEPIWRSYRALGLVYPLQVAVFSSTLVKSHYFDLSSFVRVCTEPNMPLFKDLFCSNPTNYIF